MWLPRQRDLAWKRKITHCLIVALEGRKNGVLKRSTSPQTPALLAVVVRGEIPALVFVPVHVITLAAAVIYKAARLRACCIHGCWPTL